MIRVTDGPCASWFEVDGKRYTFTLYKASTEKELLDRIKFESSGRDLLVWRRRPVRSKEDDSWSCRFVSVLASDSDKVLEFLESNAE